MTAPKDLPEGMKGLWRVQYDQRQAIIFNNFSERSKKIYNSWKWSKKISFIDRLQSEGYFD
jgi:hypothetical protein